MPPKSKAAANTPSKKKQKTTEKAERSPSAKKKESTALVQYDGPWRTTWIYYVWNPFVEKFMYVGQTVDLDERIKKHVKDDSKCRVLRKVTKDLGVDLAENTYLYEKLPYGVPKHKADEVEGTLIEKLNTSTAKGGCNQSNGTNLADYMDRFDEIWEAIQSGHDWWARPPAAPEPPPPTPSAELAAARREEALLTTKIMLVGDEHPKHAELSTALTIAKEDRLRLERSQLGVTELCEAFAADYEKLPRDEVVDRAGVIVGMNLITEKLNAEEERDEQMLALVRAERLFLKDTKSRTWKMSAHVAVHTFQRLAGVLESREIERMEKTPAVTKMMEVRAWSYAHGQTMPNLHGKDATERPLGAFLAKLKRGKDACYKGSDAECRFLMRNLPAYTAFLAYNRAKKSADSETSLKKLLVDGYGLPKEPAFEGKKTLERSEHKAEFQKLHNLMRGQLNETTTDRILAGLPESRIAFYKGSDYATKRAEFQKKNAETHAKERAKLHANGVKPRKRSRVEGEEEAETEEPGEEEKAGEEESDNENEGSDEDEESEE